MEDQKVFEIKVLVSDVITAKSTFKKYKMVDSNGKLIDLRFRMGTDLTAVNACKKCIIHCKYLSDASANYEYPRFYCGEIVGVEKLL